MRKSTLLWLILTVFCGIALFHTSQKVHDERARLAALNASIAHEKQSIRVLGAEWAYLNNPRRLEMLAKTYLHMAPLSAAQFIRIDDIPLRAAPAAAPAPQTEKIAVKKISPEIQPRKIVALERPVTMKTRKPAPPRIFKKRAAPDGGTATARNFRDVMKSLRLGVE